MRVRQAGVFEPAGKTQSMHQSKQESHDPWCAGGDAHKMTVFVQCCGYSLALSHARSGDAAMMSGYLGKSNEFDKAIAAFSIAYADQNEKDHAALKRAIRDERVEAVFEEAK